MVRLWHSVLQPHVPVSDVAFFEYPTGYDGPRGKFQVRLKLRNDDGAEFSFLQTRDEKSSSVPDGLMLQPDKLTVSPPFKDYSSLPLSHLNDSR